MSPLAGNLAGVNLDEIAEQQRNNATWRLLRSQNAPLVLAFLGGYFIETNRGATPDENLINALDSFLYALREEDGDAYARSPQEYIAEWTDRRWLRTFYPDGRSGAYYDVTSEFERAYTWVTNLESRELISTESRLHTLIELLRQIVYGTETDPETRIAELERRRTEIDEEITAVRENRAQLLDGSAVRDRYQQFASTARELLSDFRQVEENFRDLDRSAREKITAWQGAKGELLDDLVASRTDISSSDQGRSFEAFYNFLLSQSQQDDLARLLAQVQALEEVEADPRLGSIHRQWAQAAERTQKTVRNLSEQLRRFLDDQAWAENRRIVELIRSIEQSALQVRDEPPKNMGLETNLPGIPIALPFERPLYTKPPTVRIMSDLEKPDDLTGDYSDLLAQQFINSAELADNIRAVLAAKASIDFAELIDFLPIEHGVAELVGYLTLNEDDIDIEFAEEGAVTIEYRTTDGSRKQATLPRVTVRRK